MEKKWGDMPSATLRLNTKRSSFQELFKSAFYKYFY